MNEKTMIDYTKLIKEKNVVDEFPSHSGFGVVKAAARELLDESEFDKVYRIGPVKKDKPLHGLRKQVLDMAKKDKTIIVECRTSIQEKGGFLFFRKKKSKD